MQAERFEFDGYKYGLTVTCKKAIIVFVGLGFSILFLKTLLTELRMVDMIV